MVLPSKQHCLHLEPVDRPGQRQMLQTRWQRVVRFAAEGSRAEAFGAGKDPFDTGFSAVGRLLLALPKALIGLQQMGLNQRLIMLGSSRKDDRSRGLAHCRQFSKRLDLELKAELIETLQAMSERSGRSVGEIIQELLSKSVPPLPEPG